MSSVLSSAGKAVTNVVQTVFEPFTGGGGNDAPPATSAAQSAAAAELAPAKKADATVDEKKPEPQANTFAVRESMNVQRAAAAGAKKTANDADLLGYVPPKKRSAARAILG